MEFLWFQMPNMKNKTPFQQLKSLVDAINIYENTLHGELKKVAQTKAEIAMILVSDEYKDKILKGEPKCQKKS